MDENKYSNLVASMPIAYALHQMLYDNDGVAIDYMFLDANVAFETITGLAVDKVIGKTCLELLPQTELYWIKKYDECIRTGEKIFYENYSQSLNKYYQVTAYSPGENQFITLFLDVTERKEAYTKSENIASFYQSIIENASDGVVILDKDFIYSYVSPGAYKMFGYEPAEMRLLEANELTHPDDLEFVVAEILKTLQNPDYKPTLQYRFRKKNGEWLWIESKISNLFDNPNVQGLAINFRDITERKAFTENILQSEERYRLTQIVGNIGSWEYNVNEQNYWSSPQLYHIFGIDEDSTDFNAEIERTVHNNEFIKQTLKQLIACEKPYDIEYEITRKADGEKRIIKDTALLYCDQNGKPELVRGILTDITELRQEELKLKKSEALLTAMLKHSRFSIWSVDLNYCLLYANQTFRDDFKATFGVELVEGVNIIGILPDALKPLWIDRYERAFANVSFIEEDLIDLGDKKIYIQVSTTPVLIDGKVIGASFYGENITERKVADQKLIESSQNLSKLLIASNQFIKPKSTNVDFDEITGVLSQISGAKYVVFNQLYSDYSRTMSISGLERTRETILKYMNIDVTNTKWKREEAFESKWVDNKLTILPDIASILFTNFQSSVIKLVINTFNLGNVAIVRIDGNDRIVGNLIFIFEKGKSVQNSELIEMFTFQLGQYIERINADQALLQKMDEMERFHKLTVNRELNMIELKKEVNQLLKKAGKEEKYRIVN